MSSVNDEIVRIAARGDGVTADGRHVAFGVPGDLVQADGALVHGPHHAEPPCRHFPTCGACQLQHADEVTLREFVTDRVLNAAAGQGVEPGEVLATHLSPARSRRRATLHGLKVQRGFVLGFREERSSRVVDMHECHVLRPELFALVAPLRQMLAKVAGRHPVDVALTLVDQGVDCAISGVVPEGLEATEALLDFARDHRLARLSVDHGFGMEATWEPEPVTVALSGVPVGFPQGAFLQPTQDGEDVLLSDAKVGVQGAETIIDLFSGLGTFAFGMAGARQTVAVEGARDLSLACRQAAGRAQLPVEAVHRDLFRAPLQPDELARFEAVVLDPPRAGAREQVAALARSPVARVAYISCNPSSWARDAKALIEAGFRLQTLRPVGQFRWSTHVELTSVFLR
ncbi:MAG: class I SAM-dependent RNA methyltransferase [Qipengyuania sp.]